MTTSKFARTSGLAALAVSLAMTAIPAGAQDRQARNRYEEVTGEQRAARQEQRAERRAERVERRSEQPAQQVDRSAERQARQEARQANGRAERQVGQVDRSAERPARQAMRQDAWQANGRAERQVERRSESQGRQVQQAQRGAWQNQQARETQRRDWERQQQVSRDSDQRRAWDRQQQASRELDQRREWQRQQERNRTYADRRTRDYSGRDGWQSRNQDAGRYQDTRSGYRSGSAYRQWDRRWRNDNRYDWQRYRNSNRVVFNIGGYYAPYRDYRYRRIGVGSTLQQLFYRDSYWISDPWRYRLPEVYGPYRWVRYYDDVLLVDVYSGQVVDVIHDFFW